jgi:hypothetical protein
MDGKVSARILCISMHGGSQGWQIGKLFFVPQMLQEFNANEFTVCVYIQIK